MIQQSEAQQLVQQPSIKKDFNADAGPSLKHSRPAKQQHNGPKSDGNSHETSGGMKRGNNTKVLPPENDMNANISDCSPFKVERSREIERQNIQEMSGQIDLINEKLSEQRLEEKFNHNSHIENGQKIPTEKRQIEKQYVLCQGTTKGISYNMHKLLSVMENQRGNTFKEKRQTKENVQSMKIMTTKSNMSHSSKITISWKNNQTKGEISQDNTSLLKAQLSEDSPTRINNDDLRKECIDDIIMQSKQRKSVVKTKTSKVQAMNAEASSDQEDNHISVSHKKERKGVLFPLPDPPMTRSKINKWTTGKNKNQLTDSISPIKFERHDPTNHNNKMNNTFNLNHIHKKPQHKQYCLEDDENQDELNQASSPVTAIMAGANAGFNSTSVSAKGQKMLLNSIGFEQQLVIANEEGRLATNLSQNFDETIQIMHINQRIRVRLFPNEGFEKLLEKVYSFLEVDQTFIGQVHQSQDQQSLVQNMNKFIGRERYITPTNMMHHHPSEDPTSGSATNSFAYHMQNISKLGLLFRVKKNKHQFVKSMEEIHDIRLKYIKENENNQVDNSQTQEDKDTKRASSKDKKPSQQIPCLNTGDNNTTSSQQASYQNEPLLYIYIKEGSLDENMKNPEEFISGQGNPAGVPNHQMAGYHGRYHQYANGLRSKQQQDISPDDLLASYDNNESQNCDRNRPFKRSKYNNMEPQSPGAMIYGGNNDNNNGRKHNRESEQPQLDQNPKNDQMNLKQIDEELNETSKNRGDMTFRDMSHANQTLLQFEKIKRPKDEKKILICPFEKCLKEFSETGNLKTHMRTHTGERPFVCMECNQKFITKGHLQAHELTHTGEKPFVCEIPACNKRYSRAGRLKIHMRLHTGERPFVCPEDGCEKAFREKGNLLTHLRIHNGQKPFKCDFADCESSFTTLNHLHDHKKRHQSDRPYICGYCNSKFMRQSTMNAHMKKHCDQGNSFGSGNQLTIGQYQSSHQNGSTNPLTYNSNSFHGQAQAPQDHAFFNQYGHDQNHFLSRQHASSRQHHHPPPTVPGHHLETQFNFRNGGALTSQTGSSSDQQQFGNNSSSHWTQQPSSSNPHQNQQYSANQANPNHQHSNSSFGNGNGHRNRMHLSHVPVNQAGNRDRSHNTIRHQEKQAAGPIQGCQPSPEYNIFDHLNDEQLHPFQQQWMVQPYQNRNYVPPQQNFHNGNGCNTYHNKRLFANGNNEDQQYIVSNGQNRSSRLNQRLSSNLSLKNRVIDYNATGCQPNNINKRDVKSFQKQNQIRKEALAVRVEHRSNVSIGQFLANDQDQLNKGGASASSFVGNPGAIPTDSLQLQSHFDLLAKHEKGNGTNGGMKQSKKDLAQDLLRQPPSQQQNDQKLQKNEAINQRENIQQHSQIAKQQNSGTYLGSLHNGENGASNLQQINNQQLVATPQSSQFNQRAFISSTNIRNFNNLSSLNLNNSVGKDEQSMS